MVLTALLIIGVGAGTGGGPRGGGPPPAFFGGGGRARGGGGRRLERAVGSGCWRLGMEHAGFAQMQGRRRGWGAAGRSHQTPKME